MCLSDMSDEQLEIVQKYFPAGKRVGRLLVRSARDMINAIFSSSICKPLAVSSALPKNYPLWKRVYNTFARWCQRSVWDVLLALLRQ